MDEGVRLLAADSGALISVLGGRAGAGFATLALAFEHGTLRLSCNPDTDEIVASTDGTVDDLLEILDKTLDALKAKVMVQAWTMTNARGFLDAFQVRCLDLDDRTEACVQVEAAAGILTVARVCDHS